MSKRFRITLCDEWDNYNDAANRWWQLLLVTMSIIEDMYRRVGLPTRWLMPLWLLRGWVTGGKTRRLLRRVVKHWAKQGIYEQQLFDCGNRALSITLEWKDIRVMKGYQNDIHRCLISRV